MTGNRGQPGNAYELFILFLTVLSLGIMVALFLPLPEETTRLIRVYDNLICVVFLIDFAKRLRTSTPRRQYFIGEQGWLDLLGSIPSFGVFRLSGLLRLARIGRLARILRLLRGKKRRDLTADVLAHRGEYAAFITVMAAMLVLVVASVAVLGFESQSDQANIGTGRDALWWSVVTMTTVGYGDFFPVSPGGRITGFFLMFTGLGIIGSLASILASILVAPPSASEAPAEVDTGVVRELEAIRAELTAMRASLGRTNGEAEIQDP
jgi:voltage-gated potassium channel